MLASRIGRSIVRRVGGANQSSALRFRPVSAIHFHSEARERNFTSPPQITCRFQTTVLSEETPIEIVHGVPNIQFKTLVELFRETRKYNGKNNAFGTKKGNKYEWMTYEEFGKEVDKFRSVLAQHNFGYDDKIAIISNNRYVPRCTCVCCDLTAT